MSNRSRPTPNATALLDSLAPGDIVVPDAIISGRRATYCAAAPVIAGTLRRRGNAVRCATVKVGRHPGGVPVVLRANRWTGWTGVAAAPGDRAALDICDRTAIELARARRERVVCLAAPRSFCAGVERAIEIVERALEQRGSPLYVRKQIVHNATVVADLERLGAVFVDELDEVPDGATVVFSAHGVSPAVRAEAAARGLDVIDATCPLVAKVHAEARRFVRRGDTVVLIGHGGHEEVDGTLGEAPGEILLVENAAEVETLDVPDPARVSYLTQTTLASDETAGVVTALRQRFPALAAPPSDDICYASTNRQEALRGLAGDVDLVLVVGSPNSSNSLRLVELAEAAATPAHLIDDATDLELGWLADAGRVGLTAGASAPPHLVDGVVDALRGLGHVTVTEHRVATETIRFALPKSKS
ncbi:hypothetical protein GCM10027598_47820 [Amycolatopsis oliviviridis]|uniref:4-hydroxy-3-methylbut-2-enyl diphosphate reductase n=1 Tax=Amycolatopsis oliviviridis TaxID=1471590 RepID=A0ABQ3MDG0_9PSEU|nr:4-hydroxy-3-methylbut-2-enyl diphosphate reductase [Amycolatopsis oliviviridis]GHH37791.1 hypothetical protein GCM10017790_82670 [Amycolatopsis oliviviridis]